MKKTTLRAACLRFVLRRPETTARQLAAALSKLVSRSTAVNYGRPDADMPNRDGTTKTVGQLADIGLRRVAGLYLGRLARGGKIERLRRGVYGPPRPKLHVPAEAG